MKKILFFIMAVTLNCFVGGSVAAAAALNPAAGAIGLNVISIVASTFGVMQGGVLNAGVYTEVWTKEIVKTINAALDDSFLQGLANYDRYVNNDVIHLVDAGVDPDVLINNTTYPIPLQNLDDTDIAISLDSFVTKVTPITDDELYALSYDKIALVKEKHGNAISVAEIKKSIHALSPSSNSAATPVLITTGATQADGRKALTKNDLVDFAARLDAAGVPEEDRRLVLCSDHISDIRKFDQNFDRQFYEYQSGKPIDAYGFKFYKYIATPLYTTAGVKKSVGSIADDGEFRASIFFSGGNTFKAKGSIKMFWSPAANDPEYQRNKVNFKHRYICLPKKQRYIGAIVSGYVAPVVAGGGNGD